MRLGGSPPGYGQPAPVPGAYGAHNAEPFDWGGIKGICGGCACVSLNVLILFLLLGVSSVEIGQMALNYSSLKQRAEPVAYSSGRYFIGPFNHFIRFPSVVTTVQFADPDSTSDLSEMERGEDLLRSRTADGLDVSLEISFQYQLNATRLHDLYVTLDEAPHFHDVYVRIAVDRLTQLATEFTATHFFRERTKIGDAMQADLEQKFEEELFANVVSFQLRSVHLPDDFEDAIQETEVTKQDLQVALAEQNATRVEMQTELLKAQKSQMVTSNQAQARAQSTMLANTADIAQYTATQHRATDGYVEILEALDDDGAEALRYMQARVLRDHPSDKTLVGLGATSAATPLVSVK